MQIEDVDKPLNYKINHILIDIGKYTYMNNLFDLLIKYPNIN